MKIGVISDTHDLLRPEVTQILQTCDAIVHAGDISNDSVLIKLQSIAPTYAVLGNNDRALAEKLKTTLSVKIGGLRFFVIHNKANAPKISEDTDVFVFGHSHRYFEEKKDGVLYLNPGSCGRRRFDKEISMAVINTDERGCTVEKIEL